MFILICVNCKTENEEGLKHCSSCGKLINSMPFWKHLFNWKYYLALLIIGIFIGYDAYMIGTDKPTGRFGSIVFILIILQTINFKANFLKKILMFFSSFFMMAILLNVIISLTNEILLNINGNKYINAMIKANSKLPKMINEDFQIVKYTSPDSNTIVMQGKFVKYTKDEILEDSSNSISQFENEMLKGEEETSCSNDNVKKLLSTGVRMDIEYLGKNNNIIGKITITDEICKSYYK